MGAPTGTFGAAGGTTGARIGMDGAERRAALKAYAALGLLLAVIDTGNVFSTVRDGATLGHPISIIEPLVWEGSSAISFLIFAPVVYLAARFASPRPGRWPWFALVHLPASILFSSLHILGMSVLRIWAYALAGTHYRGPLFDFVYEYRKDIPAYIIIAGLIWLLRELEIRRRPSGPQSIPTFDIKDGARLIRAQVPEIVAVSSAGNYVEVILADGRRPLMRSTLAQAEAALAPHGFVRTHRSWLVNAAKVRELVAQGSGDYNLRLDGGFEAPLSRRFPVALQCLRAGGGQDHFAPAGGLG
jgi:hypothetical protein